MAGLLLADRVPLPLFPLLTGAALLWLALLALCLVPGRVPGLRSSVALALGFLLGALRYQLATGVSPPGHILTAGRYGTEAAYSGRVIAEPERESDRVRFPFELERAETDSLRCRLTGRVLVTVRGVPLAADYGDRLVLRGTLRQPPVARNPGGFDYRRYLAQEHVHGLLSVHRPEQVVAREPARGHWLYEGVVLPIQHSATASLTRNLSGAAGGLILGVLLGQKRALPEDLQQDFRLTGLTHALVVSGMNVGLVVLFFSTVFRLLRVPARWEAGLSLLVVGLFALVTGLQPPVLRAGVMAAVLLVGRMVGRAGNPLNSLGLAGGAIAAVWPACVPGLSFQLSFAATAALVTLSGPIASWFPAAWRRDGHRLGRCLVAPLATTLAAQVGTAPLMAFHFQQYSLVSLAANLAVVPLLGAATGLGMLSVLSGWCLPWVATAFNGANYLVLKLAILVVDLFAGLPFASVRTPRPGPLFAAWVTLCWWLAVRSSGRRRAAKPLVFALLVGANAAVWSPVWGPWLRPPRLEVSFLDVGQGDAALLRFPNGATLLVDGGDRSPQLDSGQRILLPFLRWAGVGRLDAVVATHPHDDHIGGLVAVLEQLPVGHYLDSGQAGNSAAAARLRELVAARGIRYHRVSAGDRVTGLGGATATVLHPGPAWVDTAGPAPRGLNNASVVLRVDYGQVRILLAGDAEDEADAALLGWGEGLAATILKVPHHGSPTSCQPAFATAVRPRLALVSVGEGNRFRHPDRQVLERLDRGGAQVFRTDRDGALQVWSDGSRIETRAMVRE